MRLLEGSGVGLWGCLIPGTRLGRAGLICGTQARPDGALAQLGLAQRGGVSLVAI